MATNACYNEWLAATATNPSQPPQLSCSAPPPTCPLNAYHLQSPGERSKAAGTQIHQIGPIDPHQFANCMSSAVYCAHTHTHTHCYGNTHTYTYAYIHTKAEAFVNKCWANTHYLKRPPIAHMKVISLTRFISYYLHTHTQSSVLPRDIQLSHIKRWLLVMQSPHRLLLSSPAPPGSSPTTELALKPHVTFDLTRRTLKQ